MIMGILMIIVSYYFKSRVLTDFFSGLLKGIGIGDILIGVYLIVKSFGQP